MDLKVILKPISFLLEKFKRKQKKASTSIIIIGDVQIDKVEVNVNIKKFK